MFLCFLFFKRIENHLGVQMAPHTKGRRGGSTSLTLGGRVRDMRLTAQRPRDSRWGRNDYVLSPLPIVFVRVNEPFPT